MKSRLSVFIIGVISGLLVALLALVFILPSRMFIVNESNLGFNETLKQIEAAATENGWSIPHQYDLQASMKKNGYDVNPVNVISLCNPEHASRILSSDDDRIVSALMPCRVAVYEKNGKTYISMLNAGLFAKFLGKNVSEVMNAASQENIEILQPVIAR